MSAFEGKADIVAALRGLFLFILRRSVLLDLFYQGGPNALDQPDAIRSHRQKLLGRIKPGFDQYAYYPFTKPALCKPHVCIRFVISEIHASSSPQINKRLSIKIPNQQSGSASGALDFGGPGAVVRDKSSLMATGLAWSRRHCCSKQKIFALKEFNASQGD
jgi:hypothetical protein